MEHSNVMEYMLLAYNEGLVQTGEYVFISFQLNAIHNYHKVTMIVI